MIKLFPPGLYFNIESYTESSASQYKPIENIFKSPNAAYSYQYTAVNRFKNKIWKEQKHMQKELEKILQNVTLGWIKLYLYK